MRKALQRIYLVFIFVLLYAPILTLIILSFNASKTRAKWGGWTAKWYVSLFQNSAIMDALYNTLIIAVLSAAIATLLGLTAALSLNSMRRRSRTIVLGVISLPVRLHHPVWLLDCADRAYYLQSALCGTQHHAETKTVESQYL